MSRLETLKMAKHAPRLLIINIGKLFVRQASSFRHLQAALERDSLNRPPFKGTLRKQSPLCPVDTM